MSKVHNEQSEQARVRRREQQSPQAQPTHPLHALQGQVGNAQVARMLAQRQPEDEEEIQASRDVQRVEDEEELQASRDVQRVEDEEEIQASRDIQRSAEVGFEGGEVSNETATQIQSMRGSGSALDAGTRATMEGAFNTSFSDVRVHSGGASSDLNAKVGARAFTTGSDIFLGGNASASDSHLMAHELTHVVQQRSMSPSGPMRVTAADDANEHAAEAMAHTVTSRMTKGDE